LSRQTPLPTLSPLNRREGTAISISCEDIFDELGNFGDKLPNFFDGS